MKLDSVGLLLKPPGTARDRENRARLKDTDMQYCARCQVWGPIYMQRNLHPPVYIDISRYTSLYVYIYRYTSVYVYLYIDIQLYMCIYIYIDTLHP